MAKSSADFVVGSLMTNGVAARPRQVFLTLSMGYRSAESAVQAAVSHWDMNYCNGSPYTHTIYRSEDGESVMVEIADSGGRMSFVALYKIVRLESSKPKQERAAG
jgi:hypothetical protein